MKTGGLPLWRKSNSAVAVISLALLSGCVSASIDTPQGLVGTDALPATTSDVLSLDGSSGFPTPEVRPGSVVVASAPADSAPVDTPVATPPAPVLPEAAAEAPDAPEVAPSQDVNSRIASAEEAPVAGNDGDDDSQEVVAVQPKPVAPPPQVLATVEPKVSSASGSGGFLNSLFGRSTNRTSPPAPVETQAPPRVIATASASGSASALPGVDRDRALGVRAADSETTLRPIQVASAAGLARLTPNGLRTQHSGVDVKCLKPALVRVLKTIEKRYGKPVIVTSGYRSPKRNASIRGAKNSLHIYCSAADIQVPGVDKWSLAKYVRSMPGRGGVGTYCHTKSVHVDIGPRRDWNWRCRRR